MLEFFGHPFSSYTQKVLIALWADDTDFKYRMIEDPENTVNVSSVSFWELAIKRAAGKLEIDLPALVRGARDQNLEFLAFHEGHALEVARLPDIHRDPFDRALIAKSRFEPLILVTHDTTVSRYGENVMLI